MEGLGATIKQLERLCVDHPKAREALRAVQHKQWHGLGISYSRLQQYCKDDEQARIAVAEALPGAGEHGDGPGRGHKRDSNTTSFNDDRGSGYALRRLKRDRPDLADKVVSGDLSANAAAIEAGFRKKKIQVEPTPEALTRAGIQV